MLIWIALGGLALAVAVALWWPLLRGHDAAAPEGVEADVYAEQLRAVEQETARGLLKESEAEATRAEIGRRLLRAARTRERFERRPGQRRLAALMVAVLIPAVSLGFYARFGRPDLAAPASFPAGETAWQDLGIEELVARAEARLVQTPHDGDGWAVLAPIYLHARRFDKAIMAFRNANRLLGPDAERFTGLGTAIALANGGAVTAEARAAFERALELDPNAVAPQIDLAVADRRSGDAEAAAGRWRALLARAEGDEPWLPLARQELGLLGRQDLLAGLAKDAPAAPPAGQQAMMIEGMVAGLAERLRTKGGTPEEWIRLARSNVVLGRREEAKRVVDEAVGAFSDDPQARRAIEEAATAFGLTPDQRRVGQDAPK